MAARSYVLQCKRTLVVSKSRLKDFANQFSNNQKSRRTDFPDFTYFNTLTLIQENVRNDKKKGQACLFSMKKSHCPLFVVKKSTNPTF